MLELKKITKIYETEGFKQKALNDVSIIFRKSEFASILGASGSGKTTLLNIIGGLDHYTNGDLIINGVSTKEYKDRDWDSYRNHRVGFVFQSYNLISHQSVLSNVELALTLSGVSKKERKKRAKDALEKVGLKAHIHKRPSQLSGGQMQRVAIARALVNDPNIILADEPTGALDSETSIQIMEILKEISKDKLVIMVTHNPELAEKYSNRIINLKDGKITNDTNEYEGKKEEDTQNKEKIKKTSMSLLTALSLSLNNLSTKKGRTILTAFAGSIGIIGIALILSLSNGVQEYIDRVQKETLASYPLTIEKESIDFKSMIEETPKSKKCQKNKICTKDDITTNGYLVMKSNTIKNNLTKLKEYIENNKEISQYTTNIQYSYNVDLQIYSDNKKVTRVNPNSISLTGNDLDLNSSMAMYQDTNVFKEMIESDDLLESQYKLIKGKMPEKYNELVLIVDENNQIPLSVMYTLNIESQKEYQKIIKEINDGKKKELETFNYTYDSLVGKTFKLVMNSDYYKKENNYWIDKSNDEKYLKQLIENGETLKIVGVLKAREDSSNASSGYIGYKHELTKHVINYNNEQKVSKEQKKNEKKDIFTQMKFDGYINTLDNNYKRLGIADLNDPSKINIYPKNYESKDKIKDIIKEYNKKVSKDNKINYTDMVSTLMEGITTIVNIVSYVLIAFVAISLIVSSIMIAIITYISVLERTKEIGILRAIGASKKDVSRVFNAETIIEGFVSGILGIIITIILCIPINKVIESKYNISNIAHLPLYGGISLIIISVILTVIAGLIPSRLASKKDPVEALRSE